jgi:hypothetical protein
MNYKIFIPVFLFISVFIFSCSNNAVNVIHDLTSNEITAKDRLDSAYAQASRKHSPSVKLVLIFGKNVEFGGPTNGKTDISLYSGITDPNNIGAWLYFFNKPGSDSMFIYTPNPVPGARDCIELTALFNFNTLLNLITDTSAKNIISGSLALINNSNFQISTSRDSLIDSDISLNIALNANPVIKFNTSFVPSSSSTNGSSFLYSGSGKSVNMFLIPALGTLNIPAYINNLFGFPQDLWVTNFKKLDSVSVTQNLIIGTVVRSDQSMNIPAPLNITSKAINISKY